MTLYGRIVETLRPRPFMREFWLAEDAALKNIFDDVNDPKFNEGIERTSNGLYQGMSKKHKVEKGKEQQYQELCLRNARRIQWDATIGIVGFHEELEPQWQGYVKQELVRLGVWDEFAKTYGPDKIQMTTAYPDKPYFHEK